MKMRMSLKWKLMGTTATCVAAFLIFGLVAWSTVETVKVRGPHYNKISADKDLIADILPPPHYIIESYFTVLLMVQAPDKEVIPLIVAGKHQEAAGVIQGKLNVLFDQHRKATNDLLELAKKDSEQVEAETTEALKRHMSNLYATACTALLLMVAVALICGQIKVQYGRNYDRFRNRFDLNGRKAFRTRSQADHAPPPAL